MSVIQVQAPGLLSTVQDLGREGFGPIGVSPSGAADAISLRIGNRLVGNAEEIRELGSCARGPETDLWEIGTGNSANQRVRATKSLSCFSRVSSRLNGAPHEYWG